MFVLSCVAVAGAVFVLSAYFVGTYREQFLDFNRPPTISEAEAVIPMEYALMSREKNDVIFLGDSSAQHGIDPVYFESLTRLTAYNLASFGFLGVDAYCLTARAYLQNHPAPSVLVLSVCPGEPAMQSDANEIARRFVRVYGRRIGLVPHEGYLEPTVRGAGLIRDQASALLQWNGIRDLELQGGLPGETFKIHEQTCQRNRGCVPIPVDAAPPKPVAVAKKRVPLAPEWDQGVHALIEMTKQKNVQLIIRLTPIRPDAAQANYAEIQSWLDGLARSEPNVIAHSEIVQYDPSLCWDAIHVNARGMRKFTELVAEDVRAARKSDKRSAARWSLQTNERK